MRDNQSPHQARVEAFMRQAEQDVPSQPTIPPADVRLLRAKIIFEEAMETIEKGLGVVLFSRWADGRVTGGEVDFSIDPNREPDLIEIADGCADLSVVTQGTLLACGIRDEPLLAEIDRSNLAKFALPRCRCGQEMLPCNDRGSYSCNCGSGVTEYGPYRRDDGKWIKGPQWSPPDVLWVLVEQGYKAP